MSDREANKNTDTGKSFLQIRIGISRSYCHSKSGNVPAASSNAFERNHHKQSDLHSGQIYCGHLPSNHSRVSLQCKYKTFFFKFEQFLFLNRNLSSGMHLATLPKPFSQFSLRANTKLC